MGLLRRRDVRSSHRISVLAVAVGVAFAILTGADCPAADCAALFGVPDFDELPADIEVLSERTAEGGVKVMEFTFAGGVFCGKPTRIYGFYARPEAEGTYPGVVQLHGAGLQTLSPKPSEFYARNGFACISIDWCGPAKGRKVPRKPPYSEFTSTGNIAAPEMIKDANGKERKQWLATPPETSGITNGVRFVRRSFVFLRSRPEVDSEKLFLSGMSAGAHLSLLILGYETGIKGAAVKYGCAYIRDLPGYYGGYFGPLTLAPRAQQDAWLEVLDPKHGIPNYRSNVLMLSGTNDIFFWMPIVLHTWRQIPSLKALLMRPNDNHQLVGNEEIPLRYFQSILGTAPAYPTVSVPSAGTRDGKLVLSVKADGASPIKQVAFWGKRMPLSKFNFKATKGSKLKWESCEATRVGDVWEAMLPALAAGEQLVAYAMVEDETGVKISSDTIEVPEYPKWRGIRAPAKEAPKPPPKAAVEQKEGSETGPDGNSFLDPSFEGHQRGKSGRMYLNFVNGPDWDDSPENARTGTTAIRIGGIGKRNLTVGGPANGGRPFRFAVHFRAERDGVKGRLQINWGRKGGGLIKYDLKTPTLLTEYQVCEISGVTPPEAETALLIISSGTGPNETIWVDDVFYGEPAGATP